MHYLKILRSKTMALNIKYTTLIHIPINYFSNVSTPLHRWGKVRHKKAFLKKICLNREAKVITTVRTL